MFRTAALLAFGLLRLPFACPAQDSPVELKLRWEPGMTYLQESDSTTTIFLTALGKTSDQQMHVFQTTSITASKTPDDRTEARVLFVSQLGEMTFEGQSYAFDSNLLGPNQSCPQFKK